MSTPAARETFQRARRDAEKTERREAILAAAGALLSDEGIDAFSMAALGKRAGIAKGTLYLYFETREEVLLALFFERMAAWTETLAEEIEAGMGVDAFVELYRSTSLADPTFMALRARLSSVIEHNVSLERLIETKRTVADVLQRLAPQVEAALGLVAGKGALALAGMETLLVGAAQMDAGPCLDDRELPEDVRAMTQMFTSSNLFTTFAGALLVGLRDEG
jgi:AcrR family transcriptional regulator